MNPHAMSVHLVAGKLNLAPGNTEEAEQEFLRAAQLDPESAEPWRGLAQTYERTQGRRNDAASAYLKAIALQPDYVLPLNEFANFQRRQPDLQDLRQDARFQAMLPPSTTSDARNREELFEMPRQLVVVTIDLDPNTGLPHVVDGGATVNGVTVMDKGDTVLFAVAPTWPSGMIEFADETPIGQRKTRPGILHQVVRAEREGGPAHNRYRYACTLSNGAVELMSPAGAIGGGEIEINTRGVAGRSYNWLAGP